MSVKLEEGKKHKVKAWVNVLKEGVHNNLTIHRDRDSAVFWGNKYLKDENIIACVVPIEFEYKEGDGLNDD